MSSSLAELYYSTIIKNKIVMVSKFELNLIKSPRHHFIIVSLGEKIRSNQNKQKITKKLYFLQSNMADCWLSIDWHVLFSEMYSIATAWCAHVPDFQIHVPLPPTLSESVTLKPCITFTDI